MTQLNKQIIDKAQSYIEDIDVPSDLLFKHAVLRGIYLEGVLTGFEECKPEIESLALKCVQDGRLLGLTEANQLLVKCAIQTGKTSFHITEIQSIMDEYIEISKKENEKSTRT